jgi:hypothetical protein
MRVMPNVPNNATVVEACTRRIRAWGTYIDRRASIGVNGRKLAHGDVVGVYEKCLKARAKVANLRAQLAEALDEVEATEVERTALERALKPWVRGEFGDESTEANEFGFPAAKKAVRTVEQKILAVRRAKATRAARGTMGKRQKEGIRGVVTAAAAGTTRATATLVHGALERPTMGFVGASGEAVPP